MDSISKEFGYWVKEHRIKGLTGDGKEEFYVSEDNLRGYWNENRISDVLWRAGVHRQTLPPPRSIIKSYIRIFSTLIYIATPNLPSLAYFNEFNEKGSDDHILPFMEGCFPSTSEGKEVEEKFLQSQFLFSPVIFGSGLHRRDLHSRSVLPLTFQRQLSGHFGSPANTVTTKLYKLHEASKLQAKDDLVVIKEYPKSEIDHSFKNELKAYLSFQYPGNEDYVSEYFLKYHGSFKQKEKAFIILEYADEGSLIELYKSNRVPRTREELLGLFENLSELLRGLRLLHDRQLRGVHQDLKPANIFVFRNEDGGTYKYKFKIGDFGLTSFTSDEAYHIKARDNKGGIMYNAPEMTNYDDFSRSIDEGISHLVDIWSFGCVLFEAAVWAISDDRGREEFRISRCEENEPNTLLRNQGYGASFHNGDRRLDAVDKTLACILEQRRIFDDITKGFCELLLKHAIVPKRKERYDAGELGAVIRKHLDEAKTPQTSWQAPSPTGRTSEQELDQRASPRSFEYAQTSPEYNTFPRRSTSGVNQSNQRQSNRYIPINGTRDSESPHFLPPETSSDTGRELDPHPLMTPSFHGESFRSNGNEIIAKSVKESSKYDKTIKPEVAKRTLSPPTNQTKYPQYRVPQVITWIQGGKKESDELYRCLSQALEKLKKRQQIFIIDDSASMKKNHWPAVVDTFRALAHLTDVVDPDGIDLYFRSSPESTKKLPGPKLLNKFRGVDRLADKVSSQGMKQEDIIFDMEDSISKILDQVKEKISHKNPKTSLYILTDGIWDDATNSDNICGVDNAIRSLVGEMRRQNQMRSNISIQFIRFGDNEVAKARLKYLDDDLAKDFKSYDIVDTTSDRSPVWKMLLGSIIGTVDNATDD